MLVETETPGISRDIDSRALLATNIGELRRHRGQRNVIRQLHRNHQIQSSQIEILVQRLDQYEILLQELVRHIDNRR